jgi:hypothetical protein
MSELLIDKVMDEETSRRTIVKTGVKLAYAAPLVAASFKLTSIGAAAQGASPAACAPPRSACSNDGPFGCQGNAACSCAATPEGTTACFTWNATCNDTVTTCTSSADCDTHCACIADTCIGNICQPLCPLTSDVIDVSPTGPNTPE